MVDGYSLSPARRHSWHNETLGSSNPLQVVVAVFPIPRVVRSGGYGTSLPLHSWFRYVIKKQSGLRLKQLTLGQMVLFMYMIGFNARGKEE